METRKLGSAAFKRTYSHTAYSQPCFSAYVFVASTISNDNPASPMDDKGSPVDVHPINGFSHLKDAIKQMLWLQFY